MPALLIGFAARDYRIKQNAAIALSKISPETTAKEVIPVLLRDLQDSRSNFRNGALINLSQMHMLPDVLIPVFITALDDSDNTVRMNAIHALEWFGPESKAVVPKLISLTTDQNPFVRQYATNALEKIEPAWQTGR
jgi:HEAT repeat protein